VNSSDFLSKCASNSTSIPILELLYQLPQVLAKCRIKTLLLASVVKQCVVIVTVVVARVVVCCDFVILWRSSSVWVIPGGSNPSGEISHDSGAYQPCACLSVKQKNLNKKIFMKYLTLFF
jgi:hypothetical protein